MKKVVLFGECMIELKQGSATQTVPMNMTQGFAGDVFNAAVYLKRWFADIQTQMFTAVGDDEFSHNMKDYFLSEGINNDLLLTSNEKILGLYAIQTDDEGERRFTYWRSDSAARYVMSLLTPDVIEQLKKADLFFFSGISLAVILPEQRERFWQLIWELKEAGVKIAFDPNYRAKLWQSIDETKTQYDLALQICDMVLPGIEDFQLIYDLQTFEQVKSFCQPYGIEEVVIKDGPNGVMVIEQNQTHFITIEAVENVVDTTSAGDSFNGAYIGARLSGKDINDSVAIASATAGFVIQCPGAIVNIHDFDNYKDSFLSNIHGKT